VAVQKKVSLIIGILALLPLLAVVLLQPGNGPRVPQVSAAHLDSTFTTPYNISNSSSYDSTQHPRLVIDPTNYLHVTWMEGVANTANGPAYVKGQGTTWPTWEWAGPHNNPGYTNPAIALDSTGTVHLVWAGKGSAPYDILYASKAPGGAWTTPENLSNESYNTVYPSIAIDSQNRIWVAWQASISDNNTQIYVRTKPAGGAWSAVTNVSNRPNQQNLNPSIVVDSLDVPHLVWRNNAGGSSWEIFYSEYVGGSWTAVQNVSATSTASHFPRLAADKTGNVFLVWEDEIDGTDHFQTVFRRWDGTQWLPPVSQAPKRVSSSSKALYPAISADGCNLYAVWQDYRDSASYPEIYFNHSTDCGDTWQGDENVSRNGSSSYYPDIVAQSGGYGHITWEDSAPGQLDIYYSQATTPVGPTPVPTTVAPTTVVPTVPTNTPTPTDTPTPTPTPTPDPRPHGYLDIISNDPPNSRNYTRLLDITVNLSATSDVGATVTNMRVCNVGEPNPADNCPWIPFTQAMVDWPLLQTVYDCEWKPVWAKFLDNAGLESITYTDYIVYDNYLAATMSLNGGHPYANRTIVSVHTVDVDGQTEACSGLDRMSFSTNGITFTNPISYFQDVYVFLPPSPPVTHTVYESLWDRANNTGILSSSIVIDTIPPTGTAPILNYGVSSTAHLEIPVSNLHGYDQSGIANVWFANRLGGPWVAMPYVNPPHDYTWNLAYGGPPIQYPDLQPVYVMYEDGAGFGSLPGNFSQVYSGTIYVSGISSIFLPVVPRTHGLLGTIPPPAPSTDVTLILLTKPLADRPGQQVLLWLAAPREQGSALEGTLRMTLPEGLRVVRAWSAYGELLQVGDRVVTSRERTWNQQVPWILVLARVEPGAGPMQVQGDMTWDQGTVTAPPLEIENR
jgi:hypothetical protein